MTDDLIERLRGAFFDYESGSDLAHEAADALTAAQARISELEAERDAAHERGRLQGLDEAKETVLSLWAWRTCAEVANAIKALKTKGQEQ